jgi:CHAT domain-containing protein/tetratricopeptide (TPR) repeat protein
MRGSGRWSVGVGACLVCGLAALAGAEQNWAEPLTAELRQHLEKQAAAGVEAAARAEADEALDRARSLWQEVLGLTARLHGAGDWRVTDARLALAQVDLLARLKASERAQVREATRLDQRGMQLFQKGKYAEALPLFREALATCRKVLGDRHPQTATACTHLARNLWRQGKYVEAEKLDREALTIRGTLLGEEHPSTATSYNQLASDLRRQGKPVDAEKLDRQALTIQFRALGEEQPAVATSYDNLCRDCRRQGKLADAEKVGRQARVIRRKALGKEHPDTANSCRSLSYVLNWRDKRAESEVLVREALDVYCKALGKEHPDTADCYSDLAGHLWRKGDRARAEELARTALALCIKVLGEEHTNVAVEYGGLAYYLEEQGKHAEAETLYRKALAINLKVWGDDNVQTASSYHHLAVHLENRQGKYAEAETLLRKGLAITRKANGDEHQDVATYFNFVAMNLNLQRRYAEAEALVRRALPSYIKTFGLASSMTASVKSTLANVLYFQGKYADAVALQREVLAINQALGEARPQTAISHNNLARYLAGQGKHAAAEESFRKALAINLKTQGGEESVAVAVNYGNMAGTLADQGKYEEVESLLRKALAIHSKLLGEGHPDTAASHNALAEHLHAQGKHVQAEAQALLATKSYEAARLKVSFTGLGRSAYAARQAPLPFFAALLARNGKPEQAWLALEKDLGRGLFDDLFARTSRPLSKEERQQEEALLARLARLEARLVALRAGRQRSSREADELDRQREGLLGELTQFQAGLEKKHGVAVGQVYDLAHIQAALPPEAALLTWLDWRGPHKNADPNGEHWACLVRRQGTPLWVKLPGSGPQGEWTPKDDDLAAEVRKSLATRSSDPSSWQETAQRLAQQRLAPLGQDLTGIKHLIVLPSHQMAGIPLEVLTQRHGVSYAPSGTLHAWLAEHHPAGAGAPGNLLVLGDPAFAASSAVVRSREAEAFPRLLRGPGFTPLPATRQEAEALARLFALQGSRVVELLGTEARASRLAELARDGGLQEYRYLHLATHGQPDFRGGMNSYLALTPSDPSLAAADRLTAGEILHTWKLKADLVTLSACETGLGQRQGGEGYVGFAQALLLAGARSLVLSQWKVDDRATALLMQHFYQNLLGQRDGLEQPLGKAAALAEAKCWLRRLSSEEVEEAGRALPARTRGEVVAATGPVEAARPYAHPSFWAGFILIGDPGDVQQVVPVLAESAPTAATPAFPRAGSWRWAWLAVGASAVVACVAAVWRLRRRRAG